MAHRSILTKTGQGMVARRISVLAVDAHPLLREGLARLLDRSDDVELIALAASGPEAVELHDRLRPDVTVMDLQMPGMDGVEALTEIRGKRPDARVIVLAAYPGEVQARRALKAGAAGFQLKRMAHAELLESIRCVHAGGQYIPAEIANELASGLACEELSVAEVEVLKLVAAGLSNKRVAAGLQVPEETVKSRMKSIMRKLSALDRTHAVTLALMQGIIEMY